MVQWDAQLITNRKGEYFNKGSFDKQTNKTYPGMIYFSNTNTFYFIIIIFKKIFLFESEQVCTLRAWAWGRGRGRSRLPAEQEACPRAGSQDSWDLDEPKADA